MGKPTKVLIGDNSVELGMAFSKYLRNMGVDTLCRRNDINLLYNEIAAEKPDFAILTIAAPDSRTVGLIRRIKSDFPETKVIAVSYISSQKLCRETVLNGAERCIVMPVSMNELYSAITESEASAGIFKFDPAVYEYLSSVGIPSHISGYRYLGIAVCLCVMNPDYTSDITGGLYKKIAEIYDVSPAQVERSLRHVSVIMSSRGIDKALVGEKSVNGRRLTNYELICAATDGFARKYSIFD